MANWQPDWFRLRIAGTLLVVLVTVPVAAQNERPNWARSTEFPESSSTATTDSKIRYHVNAPLDDQGKPARATRLIVYTLPAGNTIEQTLGCRMTQGLDWHYDIQHVAAQTRLLRSLLPNEKIVLVCVEGPGLNWSAFRKRHSDADARMANFLAGVRKEFASDDTPVMLAGHSNGGSFMFGVVDGTDAIPDYIDRIAFLDANYNFNAEKHAAKLQKWLKGDDRRRLIVIAYDDREIMLNGKKVLGPTGGTFRATGRMHDALGKLFPLTDRSTPPFNETTGLDGRIHFYVHPNPENKILHTVLVGEMNGLVHAATLGTDQEEKWGKFGGPRAYTRFVQADPTPNPAKPAKTVPAPSTAAASDYRPAVKRQSHLPPRQKDAIGGAEFMKRFAGKDLADRKHNYLAEWEAAVLKEISSGNFPDFLRNFKTVLIMGELKKGAKEVSATLEVMPDYLAVGSDADFVRVPTTPQTAQQIADLFGCTLPTRKIVDAIDRVAEAKVAPHPMTKDREAIATFAEHNQIIETQRADKPLGQLLIGAKKDIVLTPRIFEKPQRLAIYGWRQLNGQPIQPLTIVHWNRYVDYSHGARLVNDTVELDGKSVKISDLLADPDRCGLVSDEGPMKPPRYPDE
jgi:hypothetical protein